MLIVILSARLLKFFSGFLVRLNRYWPVKIRLRRDILSCLMTEKKKVF